MASYLVLTPPGTRSGAESARFIPDGFSFFALVTPVFFMLYHRLWVYAVLLVILEALIGLAIGYGGGSDTAAALLILSLSVLIALESGQIRARYLMALGWQLDGVVVADHIDDAEALYFSASAAQGPVPPPALSPPASTGWSSVSAGTGLRQPVGPALGLFDFGKGR